MKVAINSDIGGFGISNEAVEECVKRGMKLTIWETCSYLDTTADFYTTETKNDTSPNTYFDKYNIVWQREKEVRTNPILIKVIEEMGEKANGRFGVLKVVDIPFDTLEGWNIVEDEMGVERVEEEHRVWE